jgi:hypothetical protein
VSCSSSNKRQNPCWRKQSFGIATRRFAAKAQIGVRLDELMTGAADVHAGIVEDEILELDQLAFGPQRSAGLSKIGPRDKAVADRAIAQAFIEPRQGVIRG